MARKTTKKARIFHRCRTPKILGKEGKNAQKSKEFLGKEKSKEIQKIKEKKIRVRMVFFVSVQFNREDGSGSWKRVPPFPLPRSVPGETVPTVPVSGSGSVPGPP